MKVASGQGNGSSDAAVTTAVDEGDARDSLDSVIEVARSFSVVEVARAFSVVE